MKRFKCTYMVKEILISLGENNQEQREKEKFGDQEILTGLQNYMYINKTRV